MIRCRNLLVSIFLFIALFLSAGCSTAYAELKAYDADNQYLGILLDYGTSGTWRLYLPSINKIISLNYSDNDKKHADLYGIFFYSNSDCTGTPFFESVSRDPQYLVKERSTNKYYVPNNNNLTLQAAKNIYSYNCNAGSCICSSSLNMDAKVAIQYTEVLDPQIPFATPVKLPLRFEYVTAIDVNGDGKTGLEEAIYSLQKTAGNR